jgi:hypothetical protein
MRKLSIATCIYKIQMCIHYVVTCQIFFLKIRICKQENYQKIILIYITVIAHTRNILFIYRFGEIEKHITYECLLFLLPYLAQESCVLY